MGKIRLLLYKTWSFPKKKEGRGKSDKRKNLRESQKKTKASTGAMRQAVGKKQKGR